MSVANPAWSLDNVTFTPLPGAYRFGGRPRSRMESNIALESDSGVEFIYNQFTRKVPELIFRVGETDLQAFETLHTTVNGEVTIFYISISGAGAIDSIPVRKEPGFDPQELDQPGGYEALFDYTLRLRSALI